jgi:inward rectifier potassium channel
MPDTISRPRKTRIIPRTRADAIRRVNLKTRWWQDLYHDALTMSWGAFFLSAAAIYVAINALFAVLYLLQPGAIQNAQPGSFADAFFFSVQCISTIGFGFLSPATLYGNVLVTIEAFLSLAIVALATGSVFARISRPTARVMFARNAVIGIHNGMPTLFIRLANERSSQILSAEVQVSLLRYETTQEGEMFRRFYDLKLARSKTPVFSLTFTLMHHIDKHSPLFGATPEEMAADATECLVTVTGLEEITSQTVHARYSYGPEEILWGHRFRDMFMADRAGQRYIDFGGFHETEPAEF